MQKELQRGYKGSCCEGGWEMIDLLHSPLLIPLCNLLCIFLTKVLLQELMLALTFFARGRALVYF